MPISSTAPCGELMCKKSEKVLRLGELSANVKQL